MGLSIHTVNSAVRDTGRFGLTFPVLYLLHSARNTPMQVTIPGFGSVYIRPGKTDLKVLRQVFFYRYYDTSQFAQHLHIQKRYNEICDMGQVPVIIDAGANIGATSIWYASKYPKAKILAVEPDPDNAACCRMNSQARDNIEVFEAAIGSSPGNVTLLNHGDSWSIQTQRSDAGEGGVKICTIHDLIDSVDRGRLFIAKIDIEGFESDLFSKNTSWIDDAAVLIIEPHDWMLPGQKTSQSFQKAVAEWGSELVLNGESLFYFKV